MVLNAKLVVVGGEVKTAEIKLRLPSTIGRGRGAGIMLPHPLVSRQHCELYEADGRLMVRDLGSLNGTFVNNERITEAAIPPGELLTVGAVTFRALYDMDEGNVPPPGAGPQMKVRDTIDTGTVRTLPMKPPVPEPADEATPEGADDLEFNFDEPLTPVEEEAPLPPTGGKTDVTVEEISPPKPPVPPAKSAVKAPSPKPAAAPAKLPPVPAAAAPVAPAPAAKPVAPKPAPAPAPNKATENTVDFSKIDHSDDDLDHNVAGDDDDNFGDFLKSLGTK
jgi:predicted component of type VI protein secretion system